MRAWSLSLISALAVLASALPAQAACHSRWRVTYGVDGTGIMEVDSGKKCGFNIRTGRAMIYNLSIVEQAKHGKAQTVGLSHITYAAAPGYHGMDRFTFQIDNGREGKSNVTLDVTVH